MESITNIILGPGGSGKTAIDKLFKADYTYIPYRMRLDGPRDDEFIYACPKLYDELLDCLRLAGDPLRKLGKLKESPPGFSAEILLAEKSKMLFYPVRKNAMQVLRLVKKKGISKIEIFAPVLPYIIDYFENTNISILNPCDTNITAIINNLEMKEKTKDNCELRESKPDNVTGRVESIDNEMPDWIKLIDLHDATDHNSWEFPEWRYIFPKHTSKYLPNCEKTKLENTTDNATEPALLNHQKELLQKARKRMIRDNANLKSCLLTENEIDSIDELIVHRSILDSHKFCPLCKRFFSQNGHLAN